MCALCDERDAPIGYYVCWECRNLLLRRLRELEAYLAILPVFLTPTRGDMGRGSPGYASRAPINLDVSVMLDPRSRAGDTDRIDDDAYWARSIVAGIGGMAEGIRDKRGDAAPPGPPNLARDMAYVRQTLDYCARHDWITDVADDLTELHHCARRGACDQPPASLGTCMAIGCRGAVYPTRSGARCAACARTYGGLDLDRLKAAQGTT